MHRDVVSRLDKLLAVGSSATLGLFLNLYFFPKNPLGFV